MKALVVLLAIMLVALPSRGDTPPTVGPIEAIYGRSVKGRPLVSYTLGVGPNVTVISGGVHGNELSTPGLVEKLLGYLKANPSELDGCTVVLIPRVNPDGDAAHTRGNARKVDLNRNFPGDWKPKRKGIALSPGTGPLSEPESAALAKLIDSVKPAKLVSIHWPFHMLVPTGGDGEQMARVMAGLNGYRVSDSVGYPTPGSFGTFLHDRQIAGVTLELPKQSVEAAWRANKAALLAAIHFEIGVDTKPDETPVRAAPPHADPGSLRLATPRVGSR
ncbi:MAG TPA: M14 family zinc carboxypeptidase [Capsulimonadaceae bacterium]|jgi:protein MpaA